MKQITLDDAGRAKLKTVAGEDVNLDNLAVFQAAALTTAPIRKQHPVYKDGVHSRQFLGQMLTELEKESRPVHLVHNMADGDMLPIGRVYAGELSAGTGPEGTDELLVLFWVDKTEHQSKVNLIDNGTIDQVSVAVLSKEALSNKTGFDFLGPNADFFENFMTGEDDKGNVMGKDGAHVVMNNLDDWFEMSLVGRGGAVGAKIKGSSKKPMLHLAASNQDVSPFALELSTGGTLPTPPTPAPPAPPKKEEFEMDATKFAETVAEYSGKTATAIAELNAEKVKSGDLQRQLDAAKAEITTLKASDNVAKVTELETAKTNLTAQLTAAQDLQKNLVAPLFAAAGQAGLALDADPTKAVAQVKDVVGSLRGLFSGHGNSGGARPADAGQGHSTHVNGGYAHSPYSARR